MVMTTTDFFVYTQIKNWRYVKPSRYCGWKTLIYRDDNRCLKICSYMSCCWQGIAISRINPSWILYILRYYLLSGTVNKVQLNLLLNLHY